jgi:hypothetical protein
MNVQLLIDSFVRQTMILIAQVATTAGERAPLARVANQVFLDLAQELQRQGIGRKVIADMFGMALRSYQQKVQRLSESATDSGMTLWEAVHRYLQDKEVVSRTEFLRRFCRDDIASVKGILNDLVETGLAYKTGRGDSSVYRVTPPEELANAQTLDPLVSAVSLVWVAVYRNSPIKLEKLKDLVPLDADLIERALEGLIADGRVMTQQVNGATTFSSERCLIPIGEEAGWEAGLLDHYQAVVSAICAKLRNGETRALPSDQIGGSTYSFDVWPGHPHGDRVRELLANFRTSLSQLWDEVSEYNKKGKPENGVSRVTFYCGQMVKTDITELDD